MSCIDMDEKCEVWRGGSMVKVLSKVCWQVSLVALMLGGGQSLLAKGVPTVKQLREYSESMPLVELPAKAADLVSEADAEDQQRLAVRIVRVFLVERHSLAPSLIGAMCRKVPEISVPTTLEAVRLFPESTHSIVKAAIVAAPDYATLICIQTSLEEPNRKREIVNALRRGLPDHVPNLVAALQTFGGERVESIADAVRTTKNRIGTSGTNSPANPLDALYNNPVGTPQLRFPDDPIEIPENFSGGELLDHFDVILRELLTDSGNPFADDVVVEEYVR